MYSGLRADLQAWWVFLRTLKHYDPYYPYVPDYEYGPDWTDDSRYMVDGVRRLMGGAVLVARPFGSRSSVCGEVSYRLMARF